MQAPDIARTRVLDLAARPVVRTLATLFADAGHQLLLVGGSVRDALTGAVVDDLDFATDADAATVAALVDHLGSIWDAGVQFGTVGVDVDGEKVEITTFRGETYEPGSRAPTVDFVDDVQADLARRDLTINAIALDVTCDPPTLVDPFDGAGDLAAGVLRTPGDPNVTMTEDPLRQVRVVRFAARTGFDIDPMLVAAVHCNGHRMAIVSRERVTAELRKLVAGGPAVLARALRIEADLRLHALLDERRPDVRREMAAALEAATPQTEPFAVVAACVGDHARGHLRSLKLSSAEVRRALHLVDLVDKLEVADSEVDVRRLARATSDCQWDIIAAGRVADALGRDVTAAVAAVTRVAEEHPQVLQPLPITGHDLVAVGMSGRAVGNGLAAATQLLLEVGHIDRYQALAAAKAAR